MDLWDIKAMWVKDCLDILIFKEKYRIIKLKEKKCLAKKDLS